MSELRIDWGPGYRVYFGRDGRTLIILLCGGDKRKQDADVREAVELWQELRDGQVHDTATRLRPDEAPALRALGEQAQPLCTGCYAHHRRVNDPKNDDAKLIELEQV